MNHPPEALRQLYEALQRTNYLVKLEGADRLSVRTRRNSDLHELIVRIMIDRQQPERFQYQALRRQADDKTCLTLEEKQGVSGPTILEIIASLLSP